MVATSVDGVAKLCSAFELLVMNSVEVVVDWRLFNIVLYGKKVSVGNSIQFGLGLGFAFYISEFELRRLLHSSYIMYIDVK